MTTTASLTVPWQRRVVSMFRLLCLACGAMGALFPPVVHAQEHPDHAPVRSASEDDYPPFCFVDESGRLTGFSVELLRSALQAMGRDVSFRVGPWSEVKEWLTRGEVQALPLVGRTPEREPVYDFTVPYMSLHGAIVVRTDTTGISGIDDLRGRRVSVMKGDNAEEFLRREDRGIEVVTTATFEDAFRDLSSGNCDAVVVQRLVALRMLQEIRLPNLQVISQPVEGFRQDFCFAVTEGDRETLALLNEGLALVMADGTYRHLHAEWFAAMELPAHRRIIIAGRRNAPPYEFTDDKGRPAGFLVDVTQAIARELDLDIDIQLGTGADALRRLAAQEIDAVQGVQYSPERGLQYDFTPAYAASDYVAVTRVGQDAPSALEDLRDLKVVVERGDAVHEHLKSESSVASLTAVDDQETALREVVEGRQDCALVPRLSAHYWIQKREWTTLAVGRRTLIALDCCYAMPKNSRALLAQLSEGLKVIEQSGEFRGIHERWLGVYNRRLSLSVVLRYAAAVLMPLLAVLLLSVAWTWTLRRQVARRTEELKRSEAQFRSLVEGAPDAIYVQIEGLFTYVNASACALFGAESPQQLLGTNVLDRVAPSDRDEVEAFRVGMRETGEPVPRHERNLLRLDGLETPVEVTAVPLWQEERTGAVVFMRDVTERRRTEKANEVRFALIRFAADRSADELLTYALDEICALVESPIGFYHFVEADQRTVSLQQWSTQTVERFCSAQPHGRHYDVDKAGVWVDCVIAGKPVIHEDYACLPHRKGMPDGHPHLTRELTAPVMRDGRAVAVLGAGNKPTRYTEADVETVSYLADVTWELVQRKRTEEALRRRREMLERAEAVAHVGSWEWDLASGETRWSDELFRILGLSPAGAAPPFARDGLGRLVHPEDFERLERAASRAADTGEPEEVPVRALRPDGSVRHCLVRGYPERGTDGTVVRLVGSAQDITEFRQAADRVAHLNRVLRTIRDINQLIVREHDREALIHGACEQLVRNRGYASALLVVTDATDRPVAWAEAGMREVFGPVSDLLALGELPPCCIAVHTDECIVRDMDPRDACAGCPVGTCAAGTRLLSARLLHSGVGHGYLALAVEDGDGLDHEERSLFEELAADIAFALYAIEVEEARAASEQRTTSLETQLVQAQRLESVGRLAGGVAHDYNNMLSVIIGYTELALGSVSEGDAIYDDLQEVLGAARRSADITRQLLAFARRQTIAPQTLDLNATVEGMLKMLRRLIGEDIDLAWLPEPKLGLVLMDPAQVDQMLANLCVNARDAIDGVGRITIETDNAVFDDEYCAEHPGYLPGEYVLLAVSDDGCGMDRETVERVFEPFFTTKGVGEGTGLGLSTVYGIVRQNDGFINVYSEPGKGSTFRVYLPRRADDRTEGPHAEAVEIPTAHGETVLIVEDEPQILRMGVAMLGRLGYTALAAESPSEALRLAETHDGDVHLILTDVVMPEMNGRDLVTRVQQRHPRAKALFMSGYTANVIAHHGILYEGVRFLQKPFSLEQLAAVVRAALV